MTWAEVSALRPIRLNLGGAGDCHPHPRYEHYVSVDLLPPPPGRAWAVQHDLSHAIPLPDAAVERILTEHFLEHLDLQTVAKTLADCHRLLVPHGLLRIAVPDYHSPPNRAALQRGRDPRHTDHKWLPTLPALRELVAASPFRDGQFHQYWDGQRFVGGPIDYALGWVKRTADNDPRNRCEGLGLHVVRALRDLAFLISRGFRATPDEMLARRYHPLRMTSMVVDLRRGVAT